MTFIKPTYIIENNATIDVVNIYITYVLGYNSIEM